MHRTINGQAVQVVRRVCRLMTEHNERLGAGLLRAFDDETTSGGSSIGVTHMDASEDDDEEAS